jgi:hypothetical protein
MRIMTSVVALALAASFAVPGEAAPNRKTKPKHMHQPPVAMKRAPLFAPSNNRPGWASPQQCFTDEGYGRFTPCDSGGKSY